MEETIVQKRPREEEIEIEKDLDFEEYSKKHKPYNQIISLLDSEEEEEESNEDLSPLITTLQQEINCDLVSNSNTLSTQENDQNNLASIDENLEVGLTSSTPIVLKEEEEDDKERVMRHLLQATDDELGIPNIGDGLIGFGDHGFNGGDEFSSLCDKLWEIEDERANYYDLLQSELFLWGH